MGRAVGERRVFHKSYKAKVKIEVGLGGSPLSLSSTTVSRLANLAKRLFFFNFLLSFTISIFSFGTIYPFYSSFFHTPILKPNLTKTPSRRSVFNNVSYKLPIQVSTNRL